ncbi:SH3 domain-containing protein [Dokdonia sp. PRO95]|uniref:SH3 domain-containing protein n=1 Tax=Dokdonia sp. PRO95 TaxID=1239415 RepID=UPI000555E1C7|nr:SH3 domain-containing protein [Dokdonia sp. PRO95]
MKNVIIYSFLIVVFSSCAQKAETNLESKSKGDSALLGSDIHSQSCYPNEIEAYLNDADKSGTNIRKNPNGEIITTLTKDDVNFEYMLRLTASQNGWFKIKNPIMGVENDTNIPGGEGWIHGSVISVDTRNYQGEH